MKISKSTRHVKITGDFGESLILYWLSKYEFECALVDHTGIDIIARYPHTQEIMGISVKSRNRTTGTEEDYVKIPNPNIKKVEAACAAFGCVPYFAVVVDAGDIVRGFIVSLNHLLDLFPKSNSASGWKMTKVHLDKYAMDPEIESFKFNTRTIHWW